jgi:hypothetical protein
MPYQSLQMRLFSGDAPVLFRTRSPGSSAPLLHRREDGLDIVTIVYALTNAEVLDRDRRQSLFAGDLFVYGSRPSTRAFCAASRHIIEQMLGPEPAWAQQRMSETEFVGLFTAAALSLSHIVAELASAIVTDFGCDPATTFVGAPSLVATTGRGFLAHGLGLPQHPHRDTWFAASPRQVNWWIPLYDLSSSVSFAFHTLHWETPVRNSSGDFNFEDWYETARMGHGAGGGNPLAQPRPLDPIDLTHVIRICCPDGGVILSSVAQLYSTVPNDTLRTHFSVHFQTASEDDLETGEGASDLDADTPGTSLANFVRCSDLSPIPRELVDLELDRRRAEIARRR